MKFRFRITAYVLEDAEFRKENLLFKTVQDMDHDKKYETIVVPSISIYFLTFTSY